MSASPLILNIPGQIDDLRRLTQAADQPVTVEGRGLLALLEEVWFWREEAAARLGFAIAELRVATDREGPDSEAARRAAGTLQAAMESLREALDGQFHNPCPTCSTPLAPGQAVVTFEDAGDMHAACAGATEADVKAGRMSVPFDSLDTEDMDPATIEQLRADPHVRIHPRARLYDDTAALRRQLERAEKAWAAFGEAQAAAEAAGEAEAGQ